VAKNHTNPTKHLHKLPSFVYYNEVDVLVLMVRTSVETPFGWQDFKVIVMIKLSIRANSDGPKDDQRLIECWGLTLVLQKIRSPIKG
jgi:hypothetical protein